MSTESRIAIFGGTGYVGSYLVDALLESGKHPVLLVRDGSEHKLRHPESCTIISGDIEDEKAVTATLADVEAVIYNIGILREFPDREVTSRKLHYDYARRVMMEGNTCGPDALLSLGISPRTFSVENLRYLNSGILESSR